MRPILQKSRGEHRGRRPPPSLSASEINGVVRRLGFVLSQAYTVMQSNLISNNRLDLAEALGDCLKPLVDMLLHFELEDHDGSP